jgi:endogenous inhibitor of DNA gyrase (YacG/DUF329 family)
MPADPPKDADKALKASKACPECGKPAENPKTLPFCSPRCRDVDLNRWLSGRYVIPGQENQGEDEE